MKLRCLALLASVALLGGVTGCSSDSAAKKKDKEKKPATHASEKSGQAKKEKPGEVDSDFVLRGGFR